MWEVVQDAIAEHGLYAAAEMLKDKICFTHFYWLAFGVAPRQRK